MKFSGLLLKESLENTNILNTVSINETEIWNNIDNATGDQPKTWTAIRFDFESTEDNADIKAESFSNSLKNGLWYLNFSSDDKVYVIYPEGKFFKYEKEDGKLKQDAINYGLKIGIPKSQLDW